MKVLSGKRLILVDLETKNPVFSLKEGQEGIGYLITLATEEWVYFPSADAGIRLTVLNERWHREIIDAWKILGTEAEEELFNV